MKSDMRGFSLIEVLLAVTIIGLIAAAAVPKAAHVMAVSRTQRVISDLQTLDAAAVMYETEKGTAPSDVSNLSDYVQNINKVKPPKGSTVIISGKEQEVISDAYKLEKKENDGMRATLDEHTVDDFLPSASQ